MSTSVRDRVERVRALLAQGFARHDSDGNLESGFAERLAAAVEQLSKSLGDKQPETFFRWKQKIAILELLEGDQQHVELARGLRYCRELGGLAPRKRKKAVATSSLDAGLETLPGLGPKSAETLAEKGIETVKDLLFFVPRRYDDARRARPLESLDAEDASERVTVRGQVDSVSFVRRGRRRWLDARFKEGGNTLIVRFFGAFPSAKDRYSVGTWVTLAALVSVRGKTFEMTNPDVLAVGADEEASEPRVIPRYSVVAGVPGKRIEKAIDVALERAVDDLVDAVPKRVRQTEELVTVAEAVAALHRPIATDEPADLERLNNGQTSSHRRLAYEEMFVLAAQIARRRAALKQHAALPCANDDALAAATNALPYQLTTAQARACAEIATDLAKSQPMNRLLQGDVGSGKTAVAFVSAARVCASGAQVAMMAPTEILAEQHFASLAPLAESIGLKVALLTGSVPAPSKRSLLALLGAGQIDLVIGTHALLSEAVHFKSLGLVIVDEQHRFGVAQRVRLRRKGSAPHLLVMTATPIPRSLALSVYGDLDVSVLDELPPGRVPTQTHVMRGAIERTKTYRALFKRIKSGEQAYVVCPLVEPSETDVGRLWRSAVGVHEELSRALHPHRVGLVHGRLSSDDRANAMKRFREGVERVLVATTVIEVGVDVPAATVIVIEDADHFGLAQLHQLRGRVGRGELPGQCALLCRGRTTDDASARLSVMAETTDGFRIAEEDLAIRGPGELLGARQAGLPNLRFGSLSEHVELLAKAREHAFEVLAGDPNLEASEHRGLREALLGYAADAEVFDAESG